MWNQEKTDSTARRPIAGREGYFKEADDDDSQADTGDDFVVVAGDLNDGRGQPALRRIHGYDDIFADLIQTRDSRVLRRGRSS